MGNLAQNLPSLPNANASPAEAQLQALAAKVKESLGASGVAIAEVSGESHQMVCVASCGETAPPIGTPLDINSGISGLCIHQNRMLDSYDTAVDPRVNREACEQLGIRSLVIAPIRGDSGVAGLIEVFATAPGAFNRESLDFIAQTAEEISSLHKRLAGTAVPGVRVSDKDGKRRLRIVLPFSKPIPADGNVAPAADGNGQSPSASSPLFRVVLRVIRQRSRLAGLVLAVTLAVVPAPWLIRGFSGHKDHGSLRALRSAVGGSAPSNSVDFSSTATAQDLVSEATPPVRVLMAKALAGNSDAQASLADHYAHGDGVRQDAVKAAAWYIVASSRGNQKATKSAVEVSSNLHPFEIAQVRFNVGTMFRDGLGTSRDLVTSYLWFSLAEAAGDVRAPGALGNLEQVMSPSDVSEARRRTAQWLESHRSRSAGTKNMIASNQAR